METSRAAQSSHILLMLILNDRHPQPVPGAPATLRAQAGTPLQIHPGNPESPRGSERPACHRTPQAPCTKVATSQVRSPPLLPRLQPMPPRPPSCLLVLARLASLCCNLTWRLSRSPLLRDVLRYAHPSGCAWGSSSGEGGGHMPP